MISALQAFGEATVRSATPLLLAALGEVVVERAGLINIGTEGAILAGAFGSAVGAMHGGLAAGYALGVLAGVIS